MVCLYIDHMGISFDTKAETGLNTIKRLIFTSRDGMITGRMNFMEIQQEEAGFVFRYTELGYNLI